VESNGEAQIKQIVKFGDMPTQALADRRARGVFMDWRDEIALNSHGRQDDGAAPVLYRDDPGRRP
jgi:hypothetical protein